MLNNQTGFFSSKIVQAKLAQLVQRLQTKTNQSGTGTELVTFEQVMAEAIKTLSEFYRYLALPGFQPINPLADTEPSPDDFNKNFTAIYDDLQVIFTELENLEGVILGNFNYMVSRLNRLNGKMKSVSSLLGDYILLSNYATKDAIFFGDTFTNLNRVEINSPLLNSAQCEVNQAEGIATLPINRSKQKALQITELPVINSNSNGTSGNSREAGKSFNGDISVILDGNADTWFEYERLISQDDNTPLVLDLTINLSSSQVINFVRVNPNNFGARTQIEVLAIDTSIDGNQFVSIKDEIPIAGWTTQDEDNVFILAPATSKYAGQGLYTFTPRKAKYVHLTLRQSTPYIIKTTSNTQMYRYAIGLRDVHIEALPYDTKGELISTEFTSTDEIRKVVLLSNQNPDPASVSTLASIKHFISPDNGSSWHEIRPKVSVGLANTTQAVPELIDFNGIDKTSVKTSNPVFKLRYKAALERFTKAFSDGSSDLAQLLSTATEMHKPPTTTPFSIALQQKPVVGSVRLVDPNYGSRGKEGIRYDVGVGTGARLQVQLPWKPVPRVFSKTWNAVTSTYDLVESGDETVFVDGKEWSRGDPDTSAGTEKVYKLDFNAGTLTTGDGISGSVPEDGEIVSIEFDEERLYPTHNTPHTSVLQFPTTNDQNEVELYRVDAVTKETLVLKRGAKIHPLKPYIAPSTFAIHFSDTTVFNTAGRKTYIDGESELADYGAGYWSIDYTKGIVYSYTATSASNDTTVDFYYIPHVAIASSDWNFDATGGVVIHDNQWKTLTPTAAEAIPAGLRLFGLANLAVVKGSVEFSNTSEFVKELDYIDGRTEFLSYIKTVEQIATLTVASPGVTSFSLSMQVVSSTDYTVSFSNTTLFSESVASQAACTSSGKYYVDRTNKTVYVYLTSSTSTPGTVTYYFSNPNITSTGRYSINYATGQVFTFTTTTASAGTINYQYTDYRIRYPIAREIPSSDWELDVLAQKLTIKDREILNNMRFAQVTALGARDKYYRVSYQYMKSSRADTGELEPFFTPILKDYALKIISKSRLVG